MGAGVSSLPEKLSKQEVIIAAGYMYDEDDFNAIKDSSGCITKRQLLEALNSRCERDAYKKFFQFCPNGELDLHSFLNICRDTSLFDADSYGKKEAKLLFREALKIGSSISSSKFKMAYQTFREVVIPSIAQIKGLHEMHILLQISRSFVPTLDPVREDEETEFDTDEKVRYGGNEYEVKDEGKTGAEYKEPTTTDNTPLVTQASSKNLYDTKPLKLNSESKEKQNDNSINSELKDAKVVDKSSKAMEVTSNPIHKQSDDFQLKEDNSMVDKQDVSSEPKSSFQGLTDVKGSAVPLSVTPLEYVADVTNASAADWKLQSMTITDRSDDRTDVISSESHSRIEKRWRPPPRTTTEELVDLPVNQSTLPDTDSKADSFDQADFSRLSQNEALPPRGDMFSLDKPRVPPSVAAAVVDRWMVDEGSRALSDLSARHRLDFLGGNRGEPSSYDHTPSYIKQSPGDSTEAGAVEEEESESTYSAAAGSVNRDEAAKPSSHHRTTARDGKIKGSYSTNHSSASGAPASEIWPVFLHYCPSKDMTASQLLRLLRESGLLGKGLSNGDVEVTFVKAKAQAMTGASSSVAQGKRIPFEVFQSSVIPMLAAHLGEGVDVLREFIVKQFREKMNIDTSGGNKGDEQESYSIRNQRNGELDKLVMTGDSLEGVGGDGDEDEGQAPPPSMLTSLRSKFMEFCPSGSLLFNDFVRMLKSCRFLNKKFKRTDAESLFVEVRSHHSSSDSMISFEMFEREIIPRLAAARNMSTNQIIAQLSGMSLEVEEEKMRLEILEISKQEIEKFAVKSPWGQNKRKKNSFALVDADSPPKDSKVDGRKDPSRASASSKDPGVVSGGGDEICQPCDDTAFSSSKADPSSTSNSTSTSATHRADPLKTWNKHDTLEKLQTFFDLYSTTGDMSSSQFIRLAKDMNLFDVTFTRRDAELLYIKTRSKATSGGLSQSGPRISFDQFLSILLPSVAEKRGETLDAVMSRIVSYGEVDEVSRNEGTAGSDAVVSSENDKEVEIRRDALRHLKRGKRGDSKRAPRTRRAADTDTSTSNPETTPEDIQPVPAQRESSVILNPVAVVSVDVETGSTSRIPRPSRRHSQTAEKAEDALMRASPKEPQAVVTNSKKSPAIKNPPSVVAAAQPFQAPKEPLPPSQPIISQPPPTQPILAQPAKNIVPAASLQPQQAPFKRPDVAVRPELMTAASSPPSAVRFAANEAIPMVSKADVAAKEKQKGKQKEILSKIFLSYSPSGEMLPFQFIKFMRDAELFDVHCTRRDGETIFSGAKNHAMAVELAMDSEAAVRPRVNFEIFYQLAVPAIAEKRGETLDSLIDKICKTLGLQPSESPRQAQGNMSSMPVPTSPISGRKASSPEKAKVAVPTNGVAAAAKQGPVHVMHSSSADSMSVYEGNNANMGYSMEPRSPSAPKLRSNVRPKSGPAHPFRFRQHKQREKELLDQAMAKLQAQEDGILDDVPDYDDAGDEMLDVNIDLELQDMNRGSPREFHVNKRPKSGPSHALRRLGRDDGGAPVSSSSEKPVKPPSRVPPLNLRHPNFQRHVDPSDHEGDFDDQVNQSAFDSEADDVSRKFNKKPPSHRAVYGSVLEEDQEEDERYYSEAARRPSPIRSVRGRDGDNDQIRQPEMNSLLDTKSFFPKLRSIIMEFVPTGETSASEFMKMVRDTSKIIAEKRGDRQSLKALESMGMGAANDTGRRIDSFIQRANEIRRKPGLRGIQPMRASSGDEASPRRGELGHIDEAEAVVVPVRTGNRQVISQASKAPVSKPPVQEPAIEELPLTSPRGANPAMKRGPLQSIHKGHVPLPQGRAQDLVPERHPVVRHAAVSPRQNMISNPFPKKVKQVAIPFSRELQSIFLRFSPHGLLVYSQFVKMIRTCQILSDSFTLNDAEIIYSKCKSKAAGGGRVAPDQKIPFELFCSMVIPAIANLRGESVEELISAMLVGDNGIRNISGVHAYAMRLQEDRANFAAALQANSPEQHYEGPAIRSHQPSVYRQNPSELDVYEEKVQRYVSSPRGPPKVSPRQPSVSPRGNVRPPSERQLESDFLFVELRSVFSQYSSFHDDISSYQFTQMMQDYRLYCRGFNRGDAELLHMKAKSNAIAKAAANGAHKVNFEVFCKLLVPSIAEKRGESVENIVSYLAGVEDPVGAANLQQPSMFGQGQGGYSPYGINPVFESISPRSKIRKPDRGRAAGMAAAPNGGIGGEQSSILGYASPRVRISPRDIQVNNVPIRSPRTSPSKMNKNIKRIDFSPLKACWNIYSPPDRDQKMSVFQFMMFMRDSHILSPRFNVKDCETLYKRVVYGDETSPPIPEIKLTFLSFCTKIVPEIAVKKKETIESVMSDLVAAHQSRVLL